MCGDRPTSRALLRPHRRTGRHAISIVCATGVTVSAMQMFGVFGPAASAAIGNNSYDATGSAYGFDLAIANPGTIPLGLTLQLAGPVAQSTLSSLGVSGAFAAFPYPGEVAQGVPAVGAGLVGLPAPEMPNYVSTQYGDAPVRSSTLGLTLEASSAESLAQAAGVAGSGANEFNSTSRVEHTSDDAVSVVSKASATGLTMFKQLKVDGYQSSSMATSNSAGELNTSTSLSISSLAIPLLSFKIPSCLPGLPGQDALANPIPGAPQLPPISLPPACAPPELLAPFPNGVVPVPSVAFNDGYFTATIPGAETQKVTLPAEQVLAAFKEAGFRLSYQAAEPMNGSNGKPNGVVGPVFSIGTTLPAPPPPLGDYLHGETSIDVTFGRTSAQINYDVVPGTSAGGLAVGPGGTLVPTTPTGDGTSGVDAAALPGGLTTTDASGMLPNTLLPATVAGGAPTSADQAALAANRIDGTFDRTELDWIYAALAVGAILAIAGAQLVRILGVRNPWSS